MPARPTRETPADPPKEPEALYRELLEAAGQAQFGADQQEIANAATVLGRYFPEDLLAQKRQEEFDALPDEQKRRMAQAKNYGVYGITHLTRQPEVVLALRLLAHELFPQRKEALTPHHLANLFAPKTRQNIAARFPRMNERRIEKILAGVLGLT